MVDCKSRCFKEFWRTARRVRFERCFIPMKGVADAGVASYTIRGYEGRLALRVGKDSIYLVALKDGDDFDFLYWLDYSFVKVGDRYVCRYCEPPGRVYSSLHQAWAEHVFVPFFQWLANVTERPHALELVEEDGWQMARFTEIKVKESEMILVKVAVVGSRSYTDYGEFSRRLKCILDENLIDIGCVQFVSGGAAGVDSLAQRYANEHGIGIVNHLPDWSKFGRSAGVERNKRIVDDADFVVAFWDGKSKGTKSSINYADKKRKPCKVVLSGDGGDSIENGVCPHFEEACEKFPK